MKMVICASNHAIIFFLIECLSQKKRKSINKARRFNFLGDVLEIRRGPVETGKMSKPRKW